jgi:hypothetical protein
MNYELSAMSFELRAGTFPATRYPTSTPSGFPAFHLIPYTLYLAPCAFFLYPSQLDQLNQLNQLSQLSQLRYQIIPFQVNPILLDTL